MLQINSNEVGQEQFTVISDFINWVEASRPSSHRTQFVLPALTTLEQLEKGIGGRFENLESICND
jgi:hypothetical protein